MPSPALRPRRSLRFHLFIRGRVAGVIAEQLGGWGRSGAKPPVGRPRNAAGRVRRPCAIQKKNPAVRIFSETTGPEQRRGRRRRAMMTARPSTFHDIDAFSRVQRFFQLPPTIAYTGSKDGVVATLLGEDTKKWDSVRAAPVRRPGIGSANLLSEADVMHVAKKESGKEKQSRRENSLGRGVRVTSFRRQAGPADLPASQSSETDISECLAAKAATWARNLRLRRWIKCTI